MDPTTTMGSLAQDHFLSLPRPDLIDGPLLPGVTDTSTLAAHDFDVDTRTGFMPPQPPLSRLPLEWEIWELTLEEAIEKRIQLGNKNGLSAKDAERSLIWRRSVTKLPVVEINNLKRSELLLRRGHHVLAWIMHFYINSLPPDAEIRIPRGITIPLLQICSQLQLPPVVTYSDDVLYNWELKSEPPRPIDDEIPAAPALDNIRSQTLFTGTKDEEEFYLASARIELRGVEVLDYMRATMDEAFLGDDIALRRITEYLQLMATVIGELTQLLLDLRKGCDPEFFYNSIRPWFRGQDSDPSGRIWTFEGLDEDPQLVEPKELSGPSAGQSTLIHALDIFMGVEHVASQKSWFDRMHDYMPRHHRNFLRHLSSNPRPLRAMVESSGDVALKEAYNVAVEALKAFRDAHVRIVAIYIVGPARKAAVVQEAPSDHDRLKPLMGTGGTDVMNFLKGSRDETASTVFR